MPAPRRRPATEEAPVPFLLRLLVNAVARWVATRLVPGVRYEGDVLPFLGVALIFGVVNAVLRPLTQLFTCPLILLTLGLFTFIVNAAMLWCTSTLAGALGLGFHVEGFVAAFLGALVVSLVSMLLSGSLMVNVSDRRGPRG
jgi:putative membrane protein